MTKPFIAITNLSTVWNDADIGEYVAGPLQIHVSRDLGPVWGVDADLGFYLDHTAIPPETAWVIAVVDDSPQIDALGLHDLTSTGLPIGFAAVKTTLACGGTPKRVLCHEVDEMAVDPMINRFIPAKFQGKDIETIIEVADPVESDVDGYDISGEPMSNFVTPAYYDTTTVHAAGTKFDFCGILTAPMTLGAGGYISVIDHTDGQGWRQVFGDKVPPHKLCPPPRYSRRERMFLRENHGRLWTPSTLI